MQNFGKINNAFNDVLVDAIINKNDDKRKIFQAYVRALKENKVLATQYLVYKNLESKIERDSTKAAEYVNENIALLQEFSPKEIKEANEKVIELLGESKNLVNAKYGNELQTLHKHITYLASHKKNPSNIDNIINSRNQISEHIVTNKEKEKLSESTIPTNVLCSVAVRKFNEKYADLSEDEKVLIKIISESDGENQSIFFTNTKNKCIELVEETLKESDSSTKEKLLEVKNRLLSMEYDVETFSENVIKLINLVNDLTD